MHNLYKVLLVEKQAQMVHVYKNMLPWEEYQFEITSVIDNEDDALAHFGEYRHDLIITGIDLKSGNGISLMRKLKQVDEHSHIIVISNHDDYDSVREAFKAGADDFLLKNRLRYSSLATALEDVRESLDQGRGNHDDENWDDKIEKMLGLVRDLQPIDDHVFKELLQQKELNILHGNYRMLYFRMDNVRIFNRNMKQYDKPDWMSTDEFINMFRNKLVLRDEMQLKVKQIIHDVFSKIPMYHLIFTKKHSGLVILPPLEKPLIKQLMKQLIDACYSVLSYEFSTTISTLANSFDDFLPLYKEVIAYHHHKFYDGDTCIEDMDEEKAYVHLETTQINFHERIIYLMSMQNFDPIFDLCKQATSYMQEHQITPNEVREYFVMIIDHIEIMIKGKDISQEYPFEVLREGINEAESIMYLDLEVEKIFKTLIDWMNANNVSKYQKKVTLMVQYIQTHLHQKLTLTMIADSIHLSEIHASRIFKKETGQGVIAYVNEQKMHVAADLLKDDKLNIKTISQQVGMDDQLYFNKVFKKVYGMSPREYRKKL